MKKILAIGNSFSEDATRYIHQIAESAGEECLVVNLYIGGCPLWYHADNIVTNKQEYRYERNGEITTRLVSISEAMAEEDWDVITIQQASGLSGKIESFTPFADELIAYVRKNKPCAKIFFHQTWAYPDGSKHPDFFKYDFSQKKMFSQIVSASRGYASSRGLGIILSGETIEELRGKKSFRLQWAELISAATVSILTLFTADMPQAQPGLQPSSAKKTFPMFPRAQRASFAQLFAPPPLKRQEDKLNGSIFHGNGQQPLCRRASCS